MRRVTFRLPGDKHYASDRLCFAVWECLSFNSHLSRREVSRAINCSLTSVQYAFRRLKQFGLIGYRDRKSLTVTVNVKFIHDSSPLVRRPKLFQSDILSDLTQESKVL